MLANLTKKNKVNLADYDYQRDIYNRLLLSQLTFDEIEIFEEILNSSVTFTISSIASALDIEITDVKNLIGKLQNTNLFTPDGEKLRVNKEIRKYFEFQLSKFDDNFKPGVDFLQNLLRKVPIQVLPAWYLIPRTSDNIFQSIIEKYLITPQKYERYLEGLNFGDPILNNIIEDLFSSPNLKIRSKTCREKYSLTRAEFEEYLLYLEFNFVCCLSYNQVIEENGWREVITPFYEWQEYLNFKKQSQPSPIPNETQIQQKHNKSFAFINDLKTVCKIIKENPLSLTSSDPSVKMVLTTNSMKTILSKCKISCDDEGTYKEYLSYFSYIIAKLCLYNIASDREGKIYHVENIDRWLDMKTEDLALFFYRQMSHFRSTIKTSLCTNANLRKVEKGVKFIPYNQWFYIDEFIQNLTISIGESVQLKKTGNVWHYETPKHSDEEIQFIKTIILERFFEGGLIDIGKCNEKICFRITQFGHDIICEG